MLEPRGFGRVDVARELSLSFHELAQAVLGAIGVEIGCFERALHFAALFREALELALAFVDCRAQRAQAIAAFGLFARGFGGLATQQHH